MIYILTHKNFDDRYVDRNHYSILHVGENDDCKNDYLRDDTGDNISKKNPHYCELTGLYWIWKNEKISEDDIVGLVHYRRYFTSYFMDLEYTYFNKMPKILGFDKIKHALNQCDIILPKKVTIIRTVGEFYSQMHDPEDLVKAREVIKKIFPDYVVDFDTVMNSHYFYYGNMFISNKLVFLNYCKWLFPILFNLESLIDIQRRSNQYQARVMGFISERLIQVWVIHNHLKIREYPVYNTEEKNITVIRKNLNRLKKLPKRIKENVKWKKE